MAAEQTMMELTLRKEATARGHLAVESLQQQFLNEKLQDGGSMAKPTDNAAALVAMLFWMVRSGRGSQLDSFLVSSTGYMIDTGRDNLYELPAVKRQVTKVKNINPGLPQPVTSGTSLLAKRTLELIPKKAATVFLERRERFMFSSECVTGARIGELAGAQVGHGVFANHYAIIEWKGFHVTPGGERLEWAPPPGVTIGDTFCEHDNETSKTDVPRVMCVVGETTGPAAIHLATALEEYWEVCGFDVVEVMEGGWTVRRPNFMVVQIALQPLRRQAEKLASLTGWFMRSSVRQVRAKCSALQSEMHRLLSSKDPSENKMFLNVAGGPAGSEDLMTAIRELAEKGITATEMEGPLLMKTQGKLDSEMGRGGSLVLPMPILVGSTYSFMQKVTLEAYEALAESGGDPDMVMGKGRDAPKFGHHSWRRLADTVANETLARGECSEADVDLHFGWKLKKYAKVMRLHYANRGKRAARAKLMQRM